MKQPYIKLLKSKAERLQNDIRAPEDLTWLCLIAGHPGTDAAGT